MIRLTPCSWTRSPSLGFEPPAAGAHVLLGDPPLRAGATDAREVDTELSRDLAYERRRANLLAALPRSGRGRNGLLVLGNRRCLRDGSVAADDDEHGPDRDDCALLDEDPRDEPRRRRRDLDRRLVGRDLDERRVLGDLLALLDEPAGDLALGQPLAEIRQLELVAHVRSIAWTPLTSFTTCVTCRSTETLASAHASGRGMPSSTSIRSSIVSMRLIRSEVEIAVEAEREPRVGCARDRGAELAVGDVERQRRTFERALDRRAGDLAVALRAVPVSRHEPRAVDGDREVERRSGDELLAVDVPAPAARRRRRVLARLGRRHPDHAEERPRDDAV